MALKIDDELVKTAMTEVMMQNINDFNTMTGGAISLSTEYFMGDAIDTSMIAEIANLITDRDPTSDLAATVKTIDSVDDHNIAIYFTTGSVEFKKVDARRYGSSSDEFSRAIGTQIGVGFLNFVINKGITAAVGAMSSEATVIEGDGTGAITYTLLNNGLAKFGDNSANIICFVMNGATNHALIGDGLTNYKIDSVAGGIINSADVGTLNRPVFVTDAAGLGMTTGVAVLGLTAAGIRIIERMAREIMSSETQGKANLGVAIQGEGEAALDIKGYTFDGSNFPDDATLGAAANWTRTSTDIKSTAGVIINVA